MSLIGTIARLGRSRRGRCRRIARVHRLWGVRVVLAVLRGWRGSAEHKRLVHWTTRSLNLARRAIDHYVLRSGATFAVSGRLAIVGPVVVALIVGRGLVMMFHALRGSRGHVVWRHCAVCVRVGAGRPHWRTRRRVAVEVARVWCVVVMLHGRVRHAVVDRLGRLLLIALHALRNAPLDRQSASFQLVAVELHHGLVGLFTRSEVYKCVTNLTWLARWSCNTISTHPSGTRLFLSSGMTTFSTEAPNSVINCASLTDEATFLTKRDLTLSLWHVSVRSTLLTSAETYINRLSTTRGSANETYSTLPWNVFFFSAFIVFKAWSWSLNFTHA